jgi:preprotein translocase subunit SecF
MNLLKPARYFFTLSAICMIASAVLLVYPGPRLSIEFTGGTRMELTFTKENITRDEIKGALEKFNPDLGPIINETQHGTFFVRTKTLESAEHTSLIAMLDKEFGAVTESQYTTIGPTVGETLKRRAALALVLAVICIILYVAWSFRAIPKRLSPWRFGIVVVITLLHDILITAGIFVVLSHTTDFEFDTLFTTALLTIFGYSVNDTIIIFDRIRENLFLQERNEDFPTVANRSLVQSVTRSFYTSLSVQIMLLSLLFLGSATIRWFVLALIIGIGLGTYSSIFVATPLLVLWRKKTHS